MQINKEKEILKLLKKGEKTASEIAADIRVNYYIIKNLLFQLITEGKIEIFEFRDKKYYRLREGKK